jgi:hypothetical protein
MKKLVAGAALAASLVIGISGVASAGERGGNGEAVPGADNAASPCAYSGLDDNDFEGDVTPGVVQSFGQIVKEVPGGASTISDRGASSLITPFGEDGCNAHMYPSKPIGRP